MPSRYGIWTQGQYCQKFHGMKHRLPLQKDSITSTILHREIQSVHTYTHTSTHPHTHARNSAVTIRFKPTQVQTVNTRISTPHCPLPVARCDKTQHLHCRTHANTTAVCTVHGLTSINQPIPPFTAGRNRYWDLEIISCSIRRRTWVKLLKNQDCEVHVQCQLNCNYDWFRAENWTTQILSLWNEVPKRPNLPHPSQYTVQHTMPLPTRSNIFS